jgi:TnpA family transposase
VPKYTLIPKKINHTKLFFPLCSWSQIGRIDKTIHMLNCIHDESYRRCTLLQLNLGEGRHSLARAVFHGKRGELHQSYREGQEDQLGALGLVLNMIVLWNTIYPRKSS